jgi:hypothetical protein
MIQPPRKELMRQPERRDPSVEGCRVTPNANRASRSPDSARAESEEDTLIGVIVTFEYDENFDRDRLISIAENARGTFEGMPGLRSKVFTIDEARRRALNFYVWESIDAAQSFFTEELRQRVTGLYGVQPTIDFLEIAALVDNLAASHQN